MSDSSRKFPNFFIVGGPKCGTTSLSEYLRNHPNVFFSDPKEPHHWAEDLPRQRSIVDSKDYHALFDDVGSEHLMAGEGSVWSLYSKVALPRIREFNPAAKIIIMVRNPVEVAQSLHSFWVAINMEDQLNFKKAWKLQPRRKQGKSLPRASDVWELYQYSEVPKFGFQLQRALGVFPRDQIKVVFFEDFSKNTELVYSEILAFLDLPEAPEATDFRVHNENKVPRSTFFASIVRRVPTLLAPSIKWFKKVTGIRNLNIMTHVSKFEKRLNQKPGKRAAISKELKQELIDEYREDIQLLEEITGRDLSHWYKND